MTPDPTEPISSRLLDTGHGLIVTFPIEQVRSVHIQGKTLPSVRAFFFKVLKHQHFFYEYQQLGAINAGAAAEPRRRPTAVGWGGAIAMPCRENAAYASAS